MPPDPRGALGGLKIRDDAEARLERGQRAREEVERRVLAAINRLDVALQFDRPNTGALAQHLHAVHMLERGWFSDSSKELVDTAPDFHLDRGDAEQLASLLARILELARNERYTVADAS